MRAFLTACLLALASSPASAQDIRGLGDSLEVRFVEADLRVIVQGLGSYLPKPLVASGLPATRASLQTPTPIARTSVPDLLRGLLEAHGFTLEDAPAFYRVQPRPTPVEAPAPVAAPRRTAGLGGPGIHVIRLRHARAPEVAATVNQLFGGTGAFSGSPGLGGTLGDELSRQGIPQGQASPGEARTGLREVGPAGLAGDVTIVPDQLTNSLLIRASDEDFATLQAAVEVLDIRPLQVLIEVLIVEARRDRSFSLSTDLFKPAVSGHAPTTTEGRVSQGSSGISDLVIRLMNIGKADIDAALALNETRGNVEIVSRPVILASNNTTARFLVGTQRPFVQVSRSLPTDAPQRDQVVQYRDVGTKLTVRPTINQDRYVSLDIQQEVNAATGEVAFDAPVISTREAVTQVLVRDGQTIVIGGLRDHQRERSSSGVPLLSGLPLVGGLFGSTGRRGTSTELYLFLTPRILASDAEADSLTAPLRKRLESTADGE